MKILFLQDDFPPESFGGAGISVYELAKGFRKLEHEVYVVTTCRSIKDEGWVEFENLKVFKIYSNYSPRWRWYLCLYNPKVIKKLKKVIKSIEPDVININNVHYHLSFYSLKIAHKFSKLVTFTARDVMIFSFSKLNTNRYLDNLDSHTNWRDHISQAGKRWNPLRNFIIKRYLKYSHKIIAISHSLKEALNNNGIHNVEVIYNGVDLENWKIDSDKSLSFSQKYNLENKKVVFFGGRLSEAKGSSIVLNAISKVKQKFPNIKLMIIGEAERFNSFMQKEVSNLGLESLIVCTGWLNRNEIKYAYANSSIILSPSLHFEAFGRVALEAMAISKTVIGSKYGGMSEVIQDGKTGFVIDPRSSELLAEKIIYLLENPEKNIEFGKKGYLRAQNEFNLYDKIEQYLKLFNSIKRE